MVGISFIIFLFQLLNYCTTILVFNTLKPTPYISSHCLWDILHYLQCLHILWQSIYSGRLNVESRYLQGGLNGKVLRQQHRLKMKNKNALLTQGIHREWGWFNLVGVTKQVLAVKVWWNYKIELFRTFAMEVAIE